MSDQPMPTPTDTIARAVLAIAGDLAGDGAMTAEVVLVEAAKRLRSLQAKADAPPTTCDWKHDSVSGVWNGTCGAAWELTSGAPAENSMKFCPNCGGVLKLQEVKP